jgi:hypothetical protein
LLSKNEASRFGPFSLELSLADVCVVRAVTVVATVIVAFCPPVVAVVGIGGAVDEDELEADEEAAVDDVGFGAVVLFMRGGKGCCSILESAHVESCRLQI